MSQISRRFDTLQSNYCVLARIVCIYFRFYCCELINHRKVRKYLMLAKHSSNTEYEKILLNLNMMYTMYFSGQLV